MIELLRLMMVRRGRRSGVPVVVVIPTHSRISRTMRRSRSHRHASYTIVLLLIVPFVASWTGFGLLVEVVPRATLIVAVVVERRVTVRVVFVLTVAVTAADVQPILIEGILFSEGRTGRRRGLIAP
jgi:hypothetical protein